MIELTDHEAYALLAAKYPDCLLDYVILQYEGDYQGEATHKSAVEAAFAVLKNRRGIGNRFDLSLTIIPENMVGMPQTMAQLLSLPPEDGHTSRWNGVSGRTIHTPFPYWNAFLNPPYGVPYGVEDFMRINAVLFPFPAYCQVFRWNDGFSNYFDDGKEWWGTGCWSVYDTVSGLFVIIGASLSD